MSRRTKPTPQEARVISAVAEVHPQTLDRWVAGKPGQPTTRARIERAIIELGLDHLLDRKRRR
jgi:hypothetical protein